MYILEDHLDAFMAKYGCVEEVSSVRNQVSIDTSDFEVMVTMSYKNFNEVLDMLTSGGHCGGEPSSLLLGVKCHGASGKIVSRQKPSTSNSYFNDCSRTQTNRRSRKVQPSLQQIDGGGKKREEVGCPSSPAECP